MQKICSNNRLGDEMGNDNDKDQTIEKDDETVASAQKRQPCINKRAGLI